MLALGWDSSWLLTETHAWPFCEAWASKSERERGEDITFSNPASEIKQHHFLWIPFIRRKTLKWRKGGELDSIFYKKIGQEFGQASRIRTIAVAVFWKCDLHTCGTQSSWFFQVSPLSCFALLSLVPFRGRGNWLRDFRKACFLNCSTSQVFNVARGSIWHRKLPRLGPLLCFFFEDTTMWCAKYTGVTHNCDKRTTVKLVGSLESHQPVSYWLSACTNLQKQRFWEFSGILGEWEMKQGRDKRGRRDRKTEREQIQDKRHKSRQWYKNTERVKGWKTRDVRKQWPRPTRNKEVRTNAVF